MTPSPVYVKPSQTMAEAATIMLGKKVCWGGGEREAATIMLGKVCGGGGAPSCWGRRCVWGGGLGWFATIILGKVCVWGGAWAGLLFSLYC